MQASNTTPFTLRPLRIATATLVLALAAGVAQTAIAQPHGGAYGGHYGGHGGGGFGAMALMHPQGLDRMLDSVNASAEQRAQIKQIAQSARDDLKTQREAGRKLHEQGQALFLQPNIDAQAAEALRQQMLAQHDQSSKRVMQAMLDVSRVLTPEQRKTLAERSAQRKAMMERHRAERQTLEPATR